MGGPKVLSAHTDCRHKPYANCSHICLQLLRTSHPSQAPYLTCVNKSLCVSHVTTPHNGHRNVAHCSTACVILWVHLLFGDRGSTVVKVLCYKSEGRWFDPSGCHWILFIDIKFFRSHYGPGVDSASNRNEYQEYFLGVKAACA